MIDIENKVLSLVETALNTYDNTINVGSEFVDVPAGFPYVAITESSNNTYLPTRDNDSFEHHVKVMYSISIFTNDVHGRKKRAKDIAEVADKVMTDNHFTRIFKSQVPNIDRSVYRMEMRYEAIIEEPVIVGTDKIYRIYQS